MEAKVRTSAVVLYVDDSADDLFLAKRVVELGNLPFSLVVAEGVNEAIQYLADAGGQLPGMVIIDYVLRNASGPELIRRLHDHSAFADIPIVAFSGRDDAACLAHCYIAGANCFLTKPQTLDELSDIMSAVASCVITNPVTVEPLKNLCFYRMCRQLEMRRALEQHGQYNVALRRLSAELCAKLDMVCAEAKEQKRRFPYPGKRDIPAEHRT